MDAAGAQIQGRRPDQEDAWRVERFADGAVLAIVADGLGGHPAGDVASRAACDEFVAQFRARRERRPAQVREWLKECVFAADAHLLELQRGARELRGMATTLVALYVHEGTFAAASVGDSYILLLRRKDLLRLNELHSESGGVTSCLGFNLTRVDLAANLALEPADRFLLATDGIAALDDDELLGLLARAPDATSAVRDLMAAIEAADQPYQDNATVVAVFA